MKTPLSLFICTSPRSGSYYFSDLLTRKGLPFGDEWFTPFQQGSKMEQYGLGKEASCSDYLQALSTRERRDGIFVIKVMYPNFREMMERLAGDYSNIRENELLGIISEIFPNPKFIFLRRRDPVAQAVSHLIAKQTGIWVKPKHQQQESHSQPVYSYTGIATTIKRRQQNEALWQQFFNQNHIVPLEVAYEDLQNDQQRVLEEVFEWLSIPLLWTEEPSKTERFSVMSTSVNAVWKKRYLEEQALCVDRRPRTSQELLEKLEIVDTTLQDSYTVSEPFSFKVFVQNKGTDPVEFRGDLNGDGWLMVLCSMEWGVRKEFFQQEIRPLDDGRLCAEFTVPGPRKPGLYPIHLALADRVMSHEDIRSASTFAKALQFQLPASRQKCRDLIPGIEDLPNGWQSLDWFGCFLDTRFPWLYHVDHEWLYIKQEHQPDGVYHVLDMHLGWVEIDPASYPEIKSLESDKAWVFKQRENDTRVFETIPSGEILRIPTNSSEDLQRLDNHPTEA